MSDTELALLARDGSADAFEEIYDRHATGVARALASFAGSDADTIDDLVQDVFFRVIEGLAGYVPRRPFPHWLFTIALNTGRNHVRDRAREIPLDPADLEAMTSGKDLATECSEEILGARLVRLVATLPEPLREVISLRIGSDLPYDEIGEILGIPEGTARSRMHNALERLREQMGVTDRESEKEQS